MPKKSKVVEAEETTEEQTEEQTEEIQEPKTYDNSGITPEDVMNIGYVQDDDAKSDLAEIVESLKSKKSVQVRKSSNHDMTVTREGRLVLKVCPLKKSYSSLIADTDAGKIKNHNKSTILKVIEDLE